MLNAHEVFARRKGFGKCDVDFLFAYETIMLVGCSLAGDIGGKHTVARPVHLTTREGGALAEDLEPHIAASIPGRSCLTLGDLGEVELKGTRVRDAGCGCEADGVAGVDGVGLRACTGGELVAADGVGGYVCCGT